MSSSVVGPLSASNLTTPSKKARHHLIISGTGRTGTTFLVEMFMHLGLETGFKPEELHLFRDKRARAGLELDVRTEGSPYVVKSPDFCDYAEEVIQRGDIVIDHVFIPMRDLQAAAESRRQVTKDALSELPPLKRMVKSIFRPKGAAGGLWQTKRRGNQEQVLLEKLYKLVLALSDSRVPVTLLRYPRLVKDCSYLYEKMSPVLKNVSEEQFRTVFEKVAQPDLAHSFNPRDR
jgi:hypothetical protein